MKRLFLMLISVSFLFSSCAIFKDSPPRLVKVNDMSHLSKSCNYTGYIKVAPVRESEVIHMMGRYKVLYAGTKYKNSQKCYGNSIVLENIRNGNIYYFHFVGKLYNRGKKVFDSVASTRSSKDINKRFFLFKATDKNGKLLDLDKELRYINTAIETHYNAIQNALFLAS